MCVDKWMPSGCEPYSCFHDMTSIEVIRILYRFCTMHRGVVLMLSEFRGVRGSITCSLLCWFVACLCVMLPCVLYIWSIYLDREISAFEHIHVYIDFARIPINEPAMFGKSYLLTQSDIYIQTSINRSHTSSRVQRTRYAPLIHCISQNPYISWYRFCYICVTYHCFSCHMYFWWFQFIFANWVSIFGMMIGNDES